MKGVKRPEEFEKKRIASLIGRTFSIETINKIRQHHIGSKRSAETRLNMSLAKKGLTGEQTNRWKGDKVGNKSLHKWVRKQMVETNICGICREQKTYLELANMTGTYNRDVKNWKYLCPKCHRRYDDTGKKGWITKRKKLETGTGTK